MKRTPIAVLGMLATMPISANAAEASSPVGGAAFSMWTVVATPVIILLGVGALVLLAKIVANRYRVVPPNKALVVTGKNSRKAVTGGGVFIMPIVQTAQELDLSAFQLQLELHNVPNKDRVPISVKAVATCKISNKEALILAAAENFAGKSQNEIREAIQDPLSGHLRLILGQMDVNTILSQRDELNKKVQEEAAGDIQKLGCEILILNIQEVTDPNGYIDSLGKPEVARAKAEAAIQEAEQKRREIVETTTARKVAETTAAENEALIAEAQRNLQTKKAQYDAEVAKQRATAEQAGPLSSAQARKNVVAAEVDVEKSKALAEVDLQKAVEERNKAKYQAEVLTKADAERKEVVIKAEAEANARTTKANAERQALEAEGQGQAKKTQLTGEAAAAAEKAKLLAEAEGKRAMLLANADGVRQELLAKAEGQQKLLDAYANMTPEQRQLFVTLELMKAAPDLVERLGDGAAKVMLELARVVTASLSNIDTISVFDSGSGQGDSALARVTKLGPDTLLQIQQLAKATGTGDALAKGLGQLMEKLGINLPALLGAGKGNGREDAPSSKLLEAAATAPATMEGASKTKAK